MNNRTFHANLLLTTAIVANIAAYYRYPYTVPICFFYLVFFTSYQCHHLDSSSSTASSGTNVEVCVQ